MDVTPQLTLDKKLQGIQLISQEKLQVLIATIPGKRNLILEASLIKPLERICTASWLKLKGIQHIYKYDATQMIHLTPDLVHIFMIRSDLRMFLNLLKHLDQQRAKLSSDIAFKSCHIVCVPSCYCYFHTLLEEQGLFGLVQLHRYNWDFIYLDQGVLSLEYPNVFGSLFVDQDTSIMPSIAQSIRVLQMVCGRPDVMFSYGEQSRSVMKMLAKLGPWSKTKESNKTNDFGAMLIIDRNKDYAASLLNPSIYSGLLLEVFKQSAGEITIERDPNKISKQKLEIFEIKPKQKTEPSTSDKPPSGVTTTTKPNSIRMNSQADEIYGDNRYKHFSQASSLVRAQAKAIGLEVQKLNDMKLDEMHDYVARKLPKITEMKTKVLRHLNASEIVIEMLADNFQRVQSLEENILNNNSRKRLLNDIDEMLTTDGQRFNTLRLLCLLHLCSGVTDDELQLFILNYCNYFGHQYLIVFHNLAKAEMLPFLQEEEKVNKSAKLLSNLPLPKFQQTEYQANVNRLKLLVSSSGAESSKNANNACPSFVFNGIYIPMIAQLCSLLLKCTNADDLSSKLGMLEKLQMFLTSAGEYEPLGIKAYASQVKNGELSDIFPMRVRNIFVYVLGGVTYAEIGACDFIGKLLGAQIVVASDSIIAGSDLISQVFL